MVLARTQSAKTGSMCATLKIYLEDYDNILSIDNIYIITGYSSVEWKEQTKHRLPDCLVNRVFHGSNLNRIFTDEIKNKLNVLIIMDEIQMASMKEQSVYKSFRESNLLDKQQLYERDIKIVEYSATPDGTIYDRTSWNGDDTNNQSSKK